MIPESERQARDHVESVVKRSKTSFFWAMRALPEENRHAMFAVYAFCREVDDIADGDGPRRSLLALGYAGWGAGQLEAEMTGESWFLAPGDANLLFDTPARRKWAAIFAASGVDSAHLVGGAGSA